MPTVGWIQEDSVERFLAGTSSVPEPGPPPAPVHQCPFCRAHFEHPAELRDHLGAAHVGPRPLLTLGGNEPSSNVVIRQKPAPHEVAVLNCTKIRISSDGLRFSVGDESKVRRILAAGTGRIRIQLENHFERAAAPVVQSYDIEFRVAEPEQIRRVDEEFVARLARADPTVADVDQFLQSPSSREATEYASGLADYVLGVLIKDGDGNAGVRRGSRDYRPKLNNALRILQSYDRPLPNLLSALIRFSSNDFSRAEIPSGYPPLDGANVFLRPLAQGRARSESGDRIQPRLYKGPSQIEVCPVDMGSDVLMRRIDQLRSTPRWTAQLQDQLRTESALTSLDPLDRVKLCALWGARAMEMNHPEAAIEPLRELVGNDPFGTWAEEALRRIDP